MYINFKMLKSKELSHSDLVLLQASKQNKVEDLSYVIEKFSDLDIDPLEEKGYLTYIAGKKKDSKASKLRLSKKGVTLLEVLETPEITEEDLVLYDWMHEIYTLDGKLIGNKKRTRIYIAEFRVHSGIERNELAHLLEVFLRDDKNMAYNNKLEFAFFKPANLFQTKFELDQSRLWQYYQSNKELIDTAYKSRIK